MRASFFSVEKEILPRLHHFLHSTFGMGSILNRCVEMNPSSACGEIAECHSPPIWNLSPRKFQISYVTSFLSGKPFSKYIQAKTASGPIPKNKIYKDTKFEKFPKMWILCGREISRNGFWSRDTLPPSTVRAVERFGNLKRLHHHHTAFHLSMLGKRKWLCYKKIRSTGRRWTEK